MQEANKREIKKPYFTLLLIIAIVYFFLAVIWRFFAPLIVAFLILVAVEPSLGKWGDRLGIGRKAFAYVSLILVIAGVAAGVWFWLIPYLQSCDFSWCKQLLEHPWVAKILVYFQDKGLGTVAEWSTTILQMGSSVLFNIGAYSLSVFLLAGVFGKLKSKLERHTEGRLLLSVSSDIITYIKAYIKTQAKLFLIISIICIPTLSIAGIANGWLLGILAGFFDFFPIFGTGTVLIPVAVWQVMEADYIAATVCIVLFLVCAVIREFLEPKFLGNAIKLPSIGIWISVYAGIQLFGVTGIFKGPIGFLLICTIYKRIRRKGEGEGGKRDESKNVPRPLDI